MATPRLFISSTCYDLQEVRYQLRTFIEEIGYEPVMSEFGDIFYDYKKHVQDSCKAEINKCQLFVLIIGNHYGNFYHKQKEQNNPDSITLQELKVALETDVYKHIFINKFVDYDYKNYINALKKYISPKLEINNINEQDYKKIIFTLKEEFSLKYFYPQESYRYIFNFLDMIYSLESNNAILPYESFDDIKNSLKKQWAGFMYDSLEGMRSVPKAIFDNVSKKIDKIENQLKILLESQTFENNTDNKVNFDLRKLISEQSLEDFELLRDKIFKIVDELLFFYDWNNECTQRIELVEKLEIENFKKWIKNLDQTIFKFKWAKTINSSFFFAELGSPFTIIDFASEIPTKAPIEFTVLMNDLMNKLSKDEYNNLVEILLIEFNRLCKVPENEIPKLEFIEDDDLPF